MHLNDKPHTNATRLPVKNGAAPQLAREGRGNEPTHDAARGFYAQGRNPFEARHMTQKAVREVSTGMGSVSVEPGRPVVAPMEVTARRLMQLMSPLVTGDAVTYGGKTWRHGMTPPAGDFLIPKGASFTVESTFGKVITWGA